MTDWYHWFLGAIVVIWWGATHRDRNAARIILVATLTSEFLVEFITRSIPSPEKLGVAGAVETVTILALLKWAPNRTGFLNCASLVVAWCAHLLCYADCKLGTRMVYHNYEWIIGGVAVAQFLAFHDTARHLLRMVLRADNRAPDVRVAGVRSAILPSAGARRPEPLPESCQTN